MSTPIQPHDYVKAIDGSYKGQNGFVTRIDQAANAAAVVFKKLSSHSVWVPLEQLKRKRFKRVVVIRG